MRGTQKASLSEVVNGIANSKNPVKPIIFGLAGQELSKDECEFFKNTNPLGFILFARNIKDKKQVKALTSSLRDLLGRDLLILIDQEGGRVARLKGSDWQEYPAMGNFFTNCAGDLNQAKSQLYDNVRLIAMDLEELGINVNCAPVLDILNPQTSSIIGDRALADNPQDISILGRCVCDALLDGGIFPVIKHIPGHGRGEVDSHLELPIVNASLEELESSDFIPFHALKDAKFAMSAHILYNAIDKNQPATLSNKVIQIIRNKIGFSGLLMTDDLSMKALSGTYLERSLKSLEAGCDILLHCNGKMTEMSEIAKVEQIIGDEFLKRLEG